MVPQVLKSSRSSSTVRPFRRRSFALDLTVHQVQAVFNETLRVFTPLHASIRESKSTGILLPPSDPTYSRGQLYLPPSSTFAYLSFLMHRNPALWGEDAHIYDPERWVDPERSQRVTANPAIFIPFSAGPRTVSGPRLLINLWSSTLIHYSFPIVLRTELRAERSLCVHCPFASTV